MVARHVSKVNRLVHEHGMSLQNCRTLKLALDSLDRRSPGALKSLIMMIRI